MNVISILHSWGYLALIYWTFCQGEGGRSRQAPKRPIPYYNLKVIGLCGTFF